MQKAIFSLKKDIVEVGRRVYARGYVASNDGNISARVDSSRILITPTGVSKGFMSTDDLILVDMMGKVLSGHKKPSSEVFLHLKIYQERADVNSVCHAHPIYATGFAVAGIPLEQCVLPEVIVALGSVPLVEYGTPGTEEFYQPVLKYLKDHDAFLLANHGALTIGADVFNAYHKMETIEHFAHIAYVAQQLGQVNILSQEQVQKLYGLRERFGIKSNVACKTCEQANTCKLSAIEGKGPDFSSSASGTFVAHEDSSGLSPQKEALIEQVTRAVLKQLG